MSTQNYLPINIVLFTSTAGHYGFDTYKTTVNHLEKKLSPYTFNEKFAHIKVRPQEAHKMPEMIDFFYENKYRVIVTEGDWSRGMSHQHEYLKDIFKIFNDGHVHSAPYSFWVEDDSPILLKDATPLGEHIKNAINILSSNKDLLNIRFSRETILKSQNNQYVIPVNTFDFQPNIGRTRDLFIAAKIIQDNWSQFQYMQCEAAFKMASDFLSYHPYKYLAFNPDMVTSYHIGAPNYEEIIKADDFKNI
jgi:hypothetical protein